MLRRWVAITLLLRRTVAVLLRLLLMISLMTAEPTARDLGLESTVLVRLPLADVAKVNVFALHRDQRNPAQLEPCARFRLHHLRVLASWTDARRSIAFLLNFRRAPKDDRDEEAKVHLEVFYVGAYQLRKGSWCGLLVRKCRLLGSVRDCCTRDAV